MHKQSFTDHYIQALERQIRWGCNEEHQKRLARLLMSARVKRLDQMTHDLIVQEHAKQFKARVYGQ